MKTLLSLFSLILILAVPVFAQEPIQNLPILQEWYSWPGAYGKVISYLPNFKKNGGENAIVQGRKNNPTWFNRFAYDTVNQFSWKDDGANYIVRGDFNGDGITDYWTARDRVHRGIAEGEFPSDIPDTNYFHSEEYGTKYVVDVNKDGYDDLLQQWYVDACTSCPLLRIVFGGKDLRHLRETIVGTSPNYWRAVSVFQNEKKEPRLVVYQSSNFAEAFYLYGLSCRAGVGDSIIVELKELDKFVESKSTKTDVIFYEGITRLYEDTKKQEHTLLVTYSTPKKTLPIAISGDKFRAGTVMKITGSVKYCLQGSIDGDDEPDWINLSIPHIVYSGNPAKDTTPRLQIAVNDCSLDGSYTYIGDVTGDGIGDFAVGNFDCFIIYKGLDWRSLSVAADSERVDFTLGAVEPNPVDASGCIAVLPATLGHSAHYILTLYDLSGREVGEVFRGLLPSGDVRIPLPINTFHLPSGMYELRLSDGKHSREHAVVIAK
ncbi:MAG: VCBS repeat-containing protein [Candidatus Kapaibacterium sp.]